MSIVDEMISHIQGQTSYKVRVKSFKHKMKTWENGRAICLKRFNVDGVDLKLEINPNGDEAYGGKEGHVSILIRNLSEVDISIKFDLALGKRGDEVKDCEANIKAGCIIFFGQFFNHRKIRRSDNDDDFAIKFTVKRLWKAFVNNSGMCNIEQRMESLEKSVKSLTSQVENSSTEQRMESLEQSVKSLMSKIENSSTTGNPPYPECPICLENMTHDTRIMQCGLGHLICQKCFDRLDYSSCPTCSKAITGRCHGMETYLKTLFDNNNK